MVEEPMCSHPRTDICMECEMKKLCYGNMKEDEICQTIKKYMKRGF